MTSRAPLITRVERPRRIELVFDPGRGSNALNAPAVTAAPFTLTDWPVPRGRQPAIGLRTWIDPLKVNLLGLDEFFGGQGGGGPSYEIENPQRGRTPAQQFLSLNLLETTLGTPQATPFQQSEWPVPRGARASIELRTFVNALWQLAPVIAAPFAQNEWPNPRGAVGSIALRTWTASLKQNLLGQDQFFGSPGMGPAYDWPNPRGPAYPLSLRTWADPLKLPLYPATVTVPDVTSESQAQATTDLNALGLVVSIQTDYSDTIAAGLVIRQAPAGGSTALVGDIVVIVVSLGAQPANRGAGRKKRRFIVEIDGQSFEVRDASHATALLERAREVARSHAQEIATEAVQSTRKVGRKPVVLPTPRINSPDPELKEIVREARKSFNELYRSTAIDAELALLLARRLAEEDEEEAILLLM